MRILYIDIDSQRPDHLGCYGYHRQTSPAIDKIASEGVVFERYYACDAPCLPSRTALYSGRFGIHTGVVGHGGTAAQPKIQGPHRGARDYFYEQGLAGRLQQMGYHTAMISPFGQRHAAWHFYAGFKEIHNTGQNGTEPAAVIQPVVEKWMKENASKDNWFLHVNYWDPHAPCRVPEEYGNPFEKDPLPEWLEDDDLIARHSLRTGPNSSHELHLYSDAIKFPGQPGKVTDRESMRRLIDRYNTATRYVDDQIAKIVAILKAQGVYEETAIIISADHGENQGELGIYADHATADESTCHIPMIFKFPSGARGVRASGLQYNIDLAPTLMELLGGQSQPQWDGKSFANAIRTGSAEGREELILSQCAHVCQRAVRWDQWLYIRTYHDGFHLFPSEMLFDLVADPHEQNDLTSIRPEIAREGLWRLQRWHDEQMQKMALHSNDVVDPLWTVVREGGPFYARLGSWRGGKPGTQGFITYLERLESTGRKAGADELRERYASRYF